MYVPKLIFTSFSVLSVLTIVCCGCGSGDSRLPVSGNITLDGKPLLAGSISFIPSEGIKSNSSGSIITDGKYSITASKGLVPGKYHVNITPMHKTNEMIKNTMTGKMENIQVSVAYKESGKLEAVIEAGKKNNIDFAITKKERLTNY